MLMTNMALETGSIDQWRSKALRGPGSGPSLASTTPYSSGAY